MCNNILDWTIDKQNAKQIGFTYDVTPSRAVEIVTSFFYKCDVLIKLVV